jgi:hypothetical protein
MSKVKTLAILGVGYVLGAQAGRQRYEQIKRQAAKVAEHPRTQQLAQQTRQTVAAKLPPAVTHRLERVAGTSQPGTSQPGTSQPGTSQPGTGRPVGSSQSAGGVTTPVTTEPTVDVSADADCVQPAAPPTHL